jgi:hypothetical protein
MDAIVAMLSRNFPNPTTEAERAEGRHHTRHFVRRYPHLRDLMQFDDSPVLYQGQLAHAVAIRADSRLVRALVAFAARVGLALYRHQFGRPAPTGAAIHASWHPNAHLDDDTDIEELLQSMGRARTLTQGRREVFDQFRFWSAVPDDAADQLCCFAAFRKSFGILAVIDPSGAHHPEDDQAFSPGFLQGFKV